MGQRYEKFGRWQNVWGSFVGGGEEMGRGVTNSKEYTYYIYIRKEGRRGGRDKFQRRGRRTGGSSGNTAETGAGGGA